MKRAGVTKEGDSVPPLPYSLLRKGLPTEGKHPRKAACYPRQSQGQQLAAQSLGTFESSPSEARVGFVQSHLLVRLMTDNL